MTGDSASGSATTSSASKDVLALSGVPVGATQGQLTPPSSQETDGPTSSTPAGATDFLSSIVGQYIPTPRLACLESIVHAGKTWTAIDIGSKGWSKQDHAAGFFDTLEGGDQDQRGHFVARCRVCAFAGSTSTYVLRGGKSSNAWGHFDNFAASPQVSDLQRRRHAAVVAFRAKNARPSAASTRGKEEPIDGYLRAARTREMSASQARPHHLRFVLMMVMTFSPFALAENDYLLEFLRGLGVPYDTQAPFTVRDVLLDIFIFLTGQLRSEVRRLQGLYRGLPFFHLITDLWTQRHGSGSYGSLVLWCVDPAVVAVSELHLGVAPFTGRHDHVNIQAWTRRFLLRYGVRDCDICSSTYDSGANVKKSLSELWPRLVPCAAHTMHLAVKASLGTTLDTATARAARRENLSQPSSPRTRRTNPAAACLLRRGRKIANHFHKSSESVAALNSVPLPGDDEPRKVLTETPGRWGSSYLALVRIFTLMPRLFGFEELPDLTAAQRHQRLGRQEWSELRHLTGVLQPAYEACVAVQRSTFTVADALKLICLLRRTMHLEEFPCLRAFDRPLAVGREDISKFLADDNGKTDLMELENRLYRYHSVKVQSSRAVDGLHDGAATFICLIQDELDRWFFNHADASKNWLSNDAVLAATMKTHGGAAMLRMAASRAGEDDPIGRARAALLTTEERLSDGDAEVASASRSWSGSVSGAARSWLTGSRTKVVQLTRKARQRL